MRRVISRGIDIAYEDTGKGEPAIVLIHPPLGFRSQLRPLSDHLSSRHRVITPDLRGTGQSGVPADAYAMADYAADIVAVCRDAGVDKAVVCGHSLGGAIALNVAAIAPELIAGVVLLDGAVLYPEGMAAQILSAIMPALEGDRWLDALRGFFAARMFADVDPPELKTAILRDLAMLPRQAAAAAMSDGLGHDYGVEIGAGRYPLMFIHARVPTDLERLKTLRPDAILASVAGSGHFMAQVVPDQVNAMLDRFLALVAEPVTA